MKSKLFNFSLNFLGVLSLFLLLSCQVKEESQPSNTIEDQTVDPKDPNKPIVKQVKNTESEKKRKRFLALGDSYTIGTSVDPNESWPIQLANRFNKSSDKIEVKTEIVAVNGETTSDLKRRIEQAKLVNQFDVVSLLIGVNNQYRGMPFSIYEKEFVELLNSAIGLAKSDSKKVFVVSIPDYSVMPFSEGLDKTKIATELDQYNAFAKKICEERGIPFINITEISRNVSERSDYIAQDQLHPSGAMYFDWLPLIEPTFNIILGEN